MSWSVSGAVSKADRDEVLASFRIHAIAQNSTCGDQYDAAVKAALMLIDSGVVGDSDKEFHLTMSGHANPDHQPVAGWANDMVNISISQK